MADHRRREESTPLVPPRSLGNRQGRDSSDEKAIWRGQTQTQEQPAQSRNPSRDDESEAEKTSPLAAAASAVAAAKERAMGSSPRAAGVSRSEDQLRAASAARPGRTRRARLRLVRIDPWSVMKAAFLLSIAFGIMCVVAVFIIWSVLGAANVFDSINASVEQVIGEAFAIQDYIGMDRVLSITMLIAVLDVVLITAIATLGAFLYNLAASLLGGLELTLAEDDQ
jgi:hypothetical protein